MDPADSWERLGNALLGPYERDILDGLTGAYRALEGRIETAYKRAADGASTMPLQRLLILREQLGQELGALKLPPDLQPVVSKALRAGQQAADYWALAELRRVAQNAPVNAEEALGQLSQAASNAEAILSPGMAQQNPSALVAAAQRQAALANYAAGGRGTQAFALLNRLVEVDLRGRIIGSVEFHLASGDSWRQLRSTLQNNLELTKSRAQMVARTEMAAAMVEGTKLRYEAEGIQQVQWQAVGSSRTCGYCAPRHGKVYRLSEVVCPAHPNCRCTVTPWDPEWEELGLVDPQEEAKGRAAVLADLEAAGKEPISGPSPFEKSLGMERAPEALWSPPRVIRTTVSANTTVETFGENFMESPQVAMFMKQAGGAGNVMQKAWTKLESLPGEVGANVQKLRQFMQRQDIYANYSLFEEEVVQSLEHYRPQLDKIQRSQSVAAAFVEKNKLKASYATTWDRQLGEGSLAPLNSFFAPEEGAAGYTRQGQGMVQVFMRPGSKLGKSADLIKGVASTLDDVLTYQQTNGQTPLPFLTSRNVKSEQSWLATFVHEVGHQVHFRGNNGGNYLGSPHALKGGLASVSQYGLTNEYERFAEAFVQYTFNPAGLREHAPGLYSWVDEALTQAIENAP